MAVHYDLVLAFSAWKESGLRGYGGGSVSHPTCPAVGQKAVQASLIPLALELPLWAPAIPKGLAPDPLAIGHGSTLTVALAIVATYCTAISGVGLPPTQ